MRSSWKGRALTLLHEAEESIKTDDVLTAGRLIYTLYSFLGDIYKERVK